LPDHVVEAQAALAAPLRLSGTLVGKERHYGFGHDLMADAASQSHAATVDAHDNEAAIILYNVDFPSEVEAHGQQPGAKHPTSPVPGNPDSPAGWKLGQ
jgi:hypothetical protein